MVELELPQWLVRRENLPRKMVGKIIAESSKGILFQGCGKLEESQTCLRCGQVLTHPSSKLVGYDEVCCQRLGIPYPCLDNPNILRKQIIDATTIRKWLPKSQVIIHGDYKIPKPDDFPTQLTIENSTLRLRCHFSLRHIAKSILGYQWNPDSKSAPFNIITEPRYTDECILYYPRPISISSLTIF